MLVLINLTIYFNKLLTHLLWGFGCYGGWGVGDGEVSVLRCEGVNVLM